MVLPPESEDLWNDVRELKVVKVDEKYEKEKSGDENILGLCEFGNTPCLHFNRIEGEKDHSIFF